MPTPCLPVPTPIFVNFEEMIEIRKKSKKKHDFFKKITKNTNFGTMSPHKVQKTNIDGFFKIGEASEQARMLVFGRGGPLAGKGGLARLIFRPGSDGSFV